VPTDNVKTVPLTENEYVKGLLALMEANHLSGGKDLSAVIGQVAAMEDHLSAMTKELAAMRRELAEARKQNHPVRNALQKVVATMRGQISELREMLAGLKQGVIDGCMRALAAVKAAGLSALRNIAEFFNIRPGLEAMRDRLDDNIKHDETVIAKIEAMSGEYHEAGRHLVNMGRAIVGKELLQEARPVGKLAKAVESPIKADRAALRAMRRCVNAAIGGLIRLEKTERKPPIMETVNKLNEKIEQSRRDAPVVARHHSQNAER